VFGRRVSFTISVSSDKEFQLARERKSSDIQRHQKYTRKEKTMNSETMDSKPSLEHEVKNEITTIPHQQTPASPTPISPYETPKQPLQPTTKEFPGPHQDDSTLTVYLNLRTIPARLLLWFNITLSWIIAILIATRAIDGLLDSYFPGFDKADVARVFAGVYIGHAILAHTVGVFCGLVYELWRNPYARAPSLRGRVGREEEVAMLVENRIRAGRLCRGVLFWRA
jgi:hypothetical protein